MIHNNKTINSPSKPQTEDSVTASQVKIDKVVSGTWFLFAIWRELKFFFSQTSAKPSIKEEQADFSLLPNEIQEMIFSQVPVRNFGHLDKNSSCFVLRQQVPRARAYGYEGDDPEAAQKYITSLFKEVEILAEEKLIPKKYIVYEGYFPFRTIDIAATLKKLSTMTTEDIINLYNYFNVYLTYISKSDNSKIESFQKLAKYLILNNKLEPAKSQDLGKKALLLAAKKNLCSIVELMILLGIDFDIQDQDKKHLFNRSISNGQLKVVSLLIKKGANVNRVDSQGNTPLMEAVHSPDMVRLLLANGADIHQKNNKGETALHFAARNGNLSAVKLLPLHGADINGRDHSNLTPLNHAIWNEHLNIAQFLIEQGADINIGSSNGFTPLINAVRKGHKDLAHLLIEKGAVLNFQNNKGNTALHLAAELGHLEIVQSLTVAGADLDIRNHKGQSTLAEAIWNERKEVAAYLIENGADVNTVNGNGNTPLINAIRKGSIDLVAAIIESGRLTSLDHRNNLGYSALHFAAEVGRSDIVRLLFDQGVLINVLDNKNMTPLALATIKNQFKIVALLIEQGADVNTVNLIGNTPLIHSTPYPIITRLLLECGRLTTLNHRNNNGYTALHFAAEKNRKEVVELLLTHGANRTLLNNAWKTPRQLAKNSKTQELLN